MRCAACGQRVPSTGCSQHGLSLVYPPVEATLSTSIAPAPPRLPGYRLDVILGRGGFGTVYAARPEGGGALLAVKIAHRDKPSAAARLMRELTVLSAVGPPHAPAVFGHGTLEDGTPYIVMELVSAPTLGERLRRGRLSVSEARARALATLRALAAVHAAGYVHRDLKPENVLISHDASRAVLVDFGLSRPARTPQRPSDVTAPNALVGTTEYMAPEQCEGRSDVDARTDVYAMGILLFEMLTGRPPFLGPAALVREGHLSQRPPRPSSLVPDSKKNAIPPALEDLVLRCLAKDPAERFADAAELAMALAATSASTSDQTIAADDAQAAEPPSSRKSGAQSERRAVCVLAFVSALDGIALRRLLEPWGGEIAHAAEGRYVVAFGHEAGDDPPRRALATANALLAQEACTQVGIDLASVNVRTGLDGRRRLLAPGLARKVQFPSRADPAGVVLSEAARAIIEAAGLSTSSTLDLQRPEDGEGPPLGALEPCPPPSQPSSHPMFGRDALLDTLIGAAERATRERVPTVAIVAAEVGYGKTMLRRALAARLCDALPGAFILDLAAPDPAFGAPGGCVRELLQRGLGLPADAPTDGGRVLLADRLGRERYVEAFAPVALALGWIERGTESEGAGARRLSALEAAPGAIHTQLIMSAGEALRRRARSTPLCVILDDAHQADDATLAILEHATLAVARAPIFVCVLGRPSFVEGHPAWGARAGCRASHTMGPLDPEGAAALCRELLRPAENVPAAAVARIVERTQAVPLLLVELVRGLKTAGIVRRRPSENGFFLATDELDCLPDLPLIEWLAHRELDALPPATRAHARLVAVLGAEVTADEMDGVLRRLDREGEGSDFPLDARVGAERLVAAGVLVRRRDRYAFRHALVREAVTRSVPEATRQRIHRAATEHLRAPTRTFDARTLAELAYHAAQAGERALAERAYLALAEAARARHDYLNAERFYTRALEQSPDDAPPLPSALRGRGLMRYRLGRYPDALDDLTRAREVAREEGDGLAEIRILLDEATVLDWMAQYEVSCARAERAWALRPDEPPAELDAHLLLAMGRSMHRFSRQEDAARLFEQALAKAAEVGEEAYETRVVALLLLGCVLQGLGRLPEAARALDRAVSECEAHGDALHLASAINGRALLAACLGDKARMVDDFERVLVLGRDLGQEWLLTTGHYNLGEYLYLWDDLEAAEPHVAQALALEERRADGAPLVVAALLAARLALYRGDLAAAREGAARIRAKMGGALLVPAEDVLCAMIELATTGASEAAWEELEARSARFSVGQERVEVVEARALAALGAGRAEEARAHLERAIAIAHAIPNVMLARLQRRLAGIRASSTLEVAS